MTTPRRTGAGSGRIAEERGEMLDPRGGPPPPQVHIAREVRLRTRKL